MARGSRTACLRFTAVVKCGETLTQEPPVTKRKSSTDAPRPEARVPSVRATISFPGDLYARLQELAKVKRVSLAWVVRAATEAYVARKSSGTVMWEEREL